MKFSSISHIVHELDPKKMDTLLQQVSKTWYRFLVTSGCLYFLEKFDELSRSVVFGETEVFYRPEWIEGMNLKMNLKYYQIQKWMLQPDRAEKVDEINGVICVVFMFPSWVMILKLSKKVHFFNFVLTSAKKSKYVKAIYIYASETSRYALSENVIVYYAITSCFEDISVWSRRALLNFCWVSILLIFWLLISHEPLFRPLEPYHFLKDCNENLQIHICKLL